ncbi:hypothetical protein HALLA_00445 (plasmid) [Halostagnicola larsenii XH-48]|uniref:Uncharacterized protein n=1 Tax=Halostagnicola larsenii XH-48 TaxID=797299 RepID=W0JWZ7_9EURY|nr:hypothetical protein HALLA_00445 [Halostagnicola larsenii XH-48]
MTDYGDILPAVNCGILSSKKDRPVPMKSISRSRRRILETRDVVSYETITHRHSVDSTNTLSVEMVKKAIMRRVLGGKMSLGITNK